MNRRSFIQSFSGAMAAALALPAAPLSLKLAMAAIPAAPTAAAVPHQARFWAIYMSGLKGNCPPAILQQILGISEGEARRHLTSLVAEGVIRPAPLISKVVAKVVDVDGVELVERVLDEIEEEGEGVVDDEMEIKC